MEMPFPLDSWEDLHHLYRRSSYTAFPIHHYQHFFCRPVTSSTSIFPIYPRLVTFHPRQWLWVWPHCPGSNPFAWDSDRLPALIEYPHLPQHGLSFLLSPPLNSRVLASIWRASSPRSTALNWKRSAYITLISLLTFRLPNSPSSSIAQ